MDSIMKITPLVVDPSEPREDEGYIAFEERMRLRELCVLVCASQFFAGSLEPVTGALTQVQTVTRRRG
jgi:hypothetical protein